MIVSYRRLRRAALRGVPSRIADVLSMDDPSLISSSAVSLSTSALHAALMEHLEEKGLISAEEQRAIFERALGLLETDTIDDGGITALARHLIDQQLPKSEVSQSVKECC